MFAWLICSLIFTLALIYEYKNSIVIGDERQKQEVLNKVETADNGVVHRIAHSYVSDLYGYQTQTIRGWEVCLTYSLLNWRVVRSCRFLQSEDSGVTAADKADFGGEEFLERKAFG